ncbi:hypothetical protein PMAYCL1PPCAC_10911, partial [Pristionchus mayeri]
RSKRPVGAGSDGSGDRTTREASSASVVVHAAHAGPAIGRGKAGCIFLGQISEHGVRLAAGIAAGEEIAIRVRAADARVLSVHERLVAGVAGANESAGRSAGGRWTRTLELNNGESGEASDEEEFEDHDGRKERKGVDE